MFIFGYKRFFYLTGLIDVNLVKNLSDIKFKIENLRFEIYNLDLNKKYYELSKNKFDRNIEPLKESYRYILEKYEILIKLKVGKYDENNITNQKNKFLICYNYFIIINFNYFYYFII